MKYFNSSYAKIIALHVIIGLGFTSCNKYLDQQPVTTFTTETVFSDVNSAFMAVAGVYSRLTGDQGYGKVISLYYPMDTDETSGPSGFQDDRRGIAHYTLSATNGELARPFNQLFQGIDNANVCLDKIPQMGLYNNGSEQQKKQLRRMMGEVYTLRAQFYFDAIKLWGDLPPHFSPAYIQAVSNPFPARMNRDSLYDQIISDLAKAEDLVPWRNEVSTIGDQVDERITKGVVKGLRARISLFRGGYALRTVAPSPALGQMQRNSDYKTFYEYAYKECKEIIASNQHALNPSYKALWKDQVCAHAISDPQGELMFQATAIGGGATADSKIGFYNGPPLVIDAATSYGTKGVFIVPTYFYSFDTLDLRRDVAIAPYNVGADGKTKIGVSATSLYDGKYRRDWISNPAAPLDATSYFSLKWQMLRYSDVLLMFAEAANELNGPTAEAYEAINKVRRRGFGLPIDVPSTVADLPAGLSKTDFFTAIVNERSFEFGGEGLRKYDLIRWNLLDVKIAETIAAVNDLANLTGKYAGVQTSVWYNNNSQADDNSLWASSFFVKPSGTPPNSTKITFISSSNLTKAYSDPTSTSRRYANGFTHNKHQLLPIPQSVLDASYAFTQNPGY